MNTILKITLLIAALLSAGMVGWYVAQPKETIPENSDWLATVNGQIIDRDWFVKQMKARGGSKPGQYQSIEQKQALLDYLINQEIIFQQALASGIGDDPVVEKVYKNAVIDKFLTEQLDQRLAQVKVGDYEVQAHFKNNQSSYNKPARRRAAIIMVDADKEDDEASRSEKREKISKALSGVADLPEEVTHFGELAKIYSDDRASMYQGGVIGWLINHPARTYKWDHAVIDALFALNQPGDVSDIIETEDAFFIVRLVAAENVKEKSLSQVEQGIKNQIMQNKRQQIKADFMDSLKASAKINIDFDKLASIPALSPDTPQSDKKPPAMPSMGGAQ